MKIPQAPLTKEDSFEYHCDCLIDDLVERLNNKTNANECNVFVVSVGIAEHMSYTKSNGHFIYYSFDVAKEVGKRFVEKGWTVYFTKQKGKKEYSLFFVQNFPIIYMKGFDYYVLKKH